MALAQQFTSESGSAAGKVGGKRSQQVQKQAKEERRVLLLQATIAAALNDDEARKVRTVAQLHVLDKLIDKALERADEDAFLRLASAKEKLWKLVQTVPGSAKPNRKRQPAIDVQPLPQPVIAPEQSQ